MTRSGAAVVLVLATAACSSTAHIEAPIAVVPKVVPDYAGAALDTLHGAGFRADIASLPAVVASSPQLNGYAVITQRPRAGTRAPVGSQVVLVVSQSMHHGGPRHYRLHTRMPGVVGLRVEDACAEIASRGLRLTLRPARLPLHHMRVVAQSVPAGTSVRRSTVIVLTLD